MCRPGVLQLRPVLRAANAAATRAGAVAAAVRAAVAAAIAAVAAAASIAAAVATAAAVAALAAAVATAAAVAAAGAAVAADPSADAAVRGLVQRRARAQSLRERGVQALRLLHRQRQAVRRVVPRPLVGEPLPGGVLPRLRLLPGSTARAATRAAVAAAAAARAADAARAAAAAVAVGAAAHTAVGTTHAAVAARAADAACRAAAAVGARDGVLAVVRQPEQPVGEGLHVEPVRRLPNVRPELPGTAALPAAAAPGLAERAAVIIASTVAAAAIAAAAAVAAVDAAAVGGMPLGRARKRLGRCDVRILVQREASERPLRVVQVQGLRLLPGTAAGDADSAVAAMRGVVRGGQGRRVARRPLPHMWL